MQCERVSDAVNYGIVVAGGQGTRIGEKKQYRDLAGKPMWLRSVMAMQEGGFDRVWLVAPAEDVSRLADFILEERLQNNLTVTAGGSSRHESVKAGLAAILSACENHALALIGVHDAARPFVNPDDIRQVIQVAGKSGGAILAQPCPDTIKQVADGVVAGTVARDGLWLAQTPQVFRMDWMQQAYNLDAGDATDDSSVMERAGYPVSVVCATGDNRKITSRADLEYAECLATMRWGGAAR